MDFEWLVLGQDFCILFTFVNRKEAPVNEL